MHSIFDTWGPLRQRLDEAARRAGRAPEAVGVISVVKFAALPDIQALRASELCEWFAENRVQDAARRRTELGETSRKGWRFIGHLQTNKAKAALELFDWIDSLDSQDLAVALQRRLEGSERRLGVMVQVKLTGRETQSGLGPDEATAFIERLKGYSNLRVVGLMGIAPMVLDPEAARPAFRRLKQLYDAVFPGPASLKDGPWLSMGMSGDCEVAVEEGATLVRVGSALFKA